ncbi:MAG: hypothetical protein HY550_08640 [Elusimicrobia bacterium]|nr:hypothetical protein [Elusimicrobiota bacterium]
MNRRSILICAALLLATAGGELSAGPRVRERRPSPLSDSMRQVRRTPAPAAREAFREFSRKQGRGWKVRYNPRTALPEALTGGRTARYPGAPEQAAAAFFEENKELLKVEPAALRLVLKKEFMGLTHLQYQQYKDGLPVEFSYARVHVTAKGEVSGYQAKFEPDAPLSAVPAISGEAAVIAAQADLGRQLRVSGIELVVFPDENDGALKLAWKVRGRANGLWVYYINAADGAVLLKYDDLRRYCNNTAYGTYGTSSATVFAVSPLPGYNADSLNKTEDTWTQPARLSLRDQYVWVAGYSSASVTNAYGDFCATTPGKVFSSLKGPYFSVTNFRGASGHYDNASGEWRTYATPAQTPHPYSNSQTYSYPITVVPDPPLAADEAFAKVMPRFTVFNAGVLDQDGSVGDPDQVYVKQGDSVMGAYIGRRTVSFYGAAVENPSYTVTLEADVAGTADGFTIDISSYLVLPNKDAAVNPGSIVWSTSAAGVYLDRSLGTANALSEANAFYHLNAARRYFDGVNVNPNSANAPADLSKQVAVMVHAAGEPDTLTNCVVSCHGMRNGYYDIEKDQIMLGDGDMDYQGKYRSFALDGTIVRHEYIHLVMARIYPIINFGEFGAVSEAMADYFSMASFWREGYASQATLGNFVGAGEGAARDLSASSQPTDLRNMPDDWWGEVHEDSLILSQALYKLGNPGGANYLSTFTATSFPGQSRADVLAYAALFYFPDNFANFYDAMVDACNQFNTKWGGECTPSMRSKIQAAFSTHGIAAAAAGDSYEVSTHTAMCDNNNGPECAVDISSFAAVTATIYPLGDVDYYSLPLSAGNFRATLSLPATTIEGVYHAYSLFLFDSDRKYVMDASPALYGASSDACNDTGPCSTLAPSVTLNYTVPYGGGRYYLVVSAAPNQYFGNSEDNSTSPYTLSLSRTPQGSANARLYAASFDNDEIAFDVPYPSFPMSGSPSSATLTSAELVFEYAQLRDHNFEPIPLTRSDTAGTYLLPVALSLDYDNNDALGRSLLSGRVKLQPGFSARYPGVGTVYLEIFGRNHLGQVLSLGVSNSLNLTSNRAAITAYNNIIAPGTGGAAIIKYEALSAGSLSVKVYTQAGTLVRTVYDGAIPAGKGTVEWDGTNSSGGKAASGIYFVKTKGPGLNKIVKIAVIR